jgi:hypothetical protein
MTSTITSLVLSAVGLVIMCYAVKDGIAFDMRTLTLVVTALAATICSWLARIEASIDKAGAP